MREKIVITILLLTPFTFVLAGGSHTTTHSDQFPQPQKMVDKHYEKSTPTPVPQTPNAVVPVQPPAPAQPSSVSPTPVVDQHPPKEIPQGGGGMIPCTGPLSYGWHVDIDGGGCYNGGKAPVVKVVPPSENKPKPYIKLSDMPYTGAPDDAGLTYGQLAPWIFFGLVIPAFLISLLFRTK